MKSNNKDSKRGDKSHQRQTNNVTEPSMMPNPESRDQDGRFRGAHNEQNCRLGDPHRQKENTQKHIPGTSLIEFHRIKWNILPKTSQKSNLWGVAEMIPLE